MPTQGRNTTNNKQTNPRRGQLKDMPTQGQNTKRQAHAGAEYRNNKSTQGLITTKQINKQQGV